MKRSSKRLAAVAATLVLGSVGLASATMAEGGGPEGKPAPATRASIKMPMSMETTFVPVTPCRLFDTRSVGGPGAMANNVPRHFSVKGALGAQGGAADCQVPVGATAASINLTAISDVAPAGYVRGWAFSQPPAEATLLNFSTALNASNTSEVPLCEGDCPEDLTLRTAGSAHLIGDVLGYFIPPIHARITWKGEIYSGSSRVVDVRKVSTGEYMIIADSELEGCTVSATVSGGNSFASGHVMSDDIFKVETYSANGVYEDHTFEVFVAC